MDPMMNDLPEDALNFVLADPEIAELAKHLSEPLYSFTPRPDDPNNYDEQSSFVFDDFDGIKICLAGNACIAPESEIYDPVAKQYRRVDSITDTWHVRAWDEVEQRWVVALALQPFVKGTADLYRVCLSNGQELVCTLDHRILTSELGWKRVSELSHLPSIGDISLLGFPLSVSRSCRTVPDCQDDCLPDSRQCGEQLPVGLGSDLASLPLRDGVHGCSHCDCGLDVQEVHARECSLPYPPSSHPSNFRSLRGDNLSDASGNDCSGLCSRHGLPVVSESLCLGSQPFVQFQCRSYQQGKVDGFVRSDQQCTFSFESPFVKTHVIKIEFLRKGEFYDFTVPKYHNYELAGVVNHNSGKSVCAAYAVVRYLLTTPAPRDLCPFLICSQSFDMCGAIAQEKLAPFLRGMIESAKWRNVARQFPAEYVLKPSVNGNRWVLDFRSYEQGRQQFQAISAGGFWCDEQMSDWQIVTELVMRCRDYSKTLKMITLTPLEPAYDLESIYQRRHEFEISRSYKFSRMNTMKNMELSSSWRESFFDVVPEDMVATRQLGAFAAFEGLIYKEFRDEVHLFKPKKRAPVNAIHFRSIDFGFRNAACLWAYELAGNFYVYDELLIHNTLSESMAEQIKNISKSWGWIDGDVAYSTTYADWEDPAAMVRMRNVGIPCVPARKDVGAGIDCVRSKFIGAGKIPQLYISDKCVELIRELKEYVWMKPAKNPWNKVNEVDKPVKYHDHLADALRYLIYSRECSIVKPWSAVKAGASVKQRAMLGR